MVQESDDKEECMLSIIAMLVLLIACFVVTGALVLFCATVIAVPPPHAAPYAPHHAPGAARVTLVPSQQGQ